MKLNYISKRKCLILLVRLSEAPSFGKSIIAYDQKSSAAQFYIDLAKEVVKNNVD